MEESVLLGTKPLVDSIRHFIRDPSGVFSVPTGKVKKAGNRTVATPYNITINNKLNLHYL